MATFDEVKGLVQPFEGYLREERMRGKETVKRYVAIVRDFALYLQRAHAELPLDAITRHHTSNAILPKATTTRTFGKHASSASRCG